AAIQGASLAQRAVFSVPRRGRVRTDRERRFRRRKGGIASQLWIWSDIPTMAVSTPLTSVKDIRVTLRESFGFDQFRPGQEAVIRKLLEGKSALAVFPTGS